MAATLFFGLMFLITALSLFFLCVNRDDDGGLYFSIESFWSNFERFFKSTSDRVSVISGSSDYNSAMACIKNMYLKHPEYIKPEEMHGLNIFCAFELQTFLLEVNLFRNNMRKIMLRMSDKKIIMIDPKNINEMESMRIYIRRNGHRVVDGGMIWGVRHNSDGTSKNIRWRINYFNDLQRLFLDTFDLPLHDRTKCKDDDYFTPQYLRIKKSLKPYISGKSRAA